MTTQPVPSAPGQRLGLSELQVAVERHRAQRRVDLRRHLHARIVVADVRARLVGQSALDALDALDRLSLDEQLVLVELERANE